MGIFKHNGEDFAYPFSIHAPANVGRTKKITANEQVVCLFMYDQGKFGPAAKVIRFRRVPDPIAVNQLVQNKDVAELKKCFEVTWVPQKYLDFDSIIRSAAALSTIDFTAVANLIDPKGAPSNWKGKGDWKPSGPSPKIVHYGNVLRESAKSWTVSINGIEDNFPKSVSELVGVMASGDGIVTFTVFKTEEWLLKKKYSADMIQKFKDAEVAILGKIGTADAA